MDSSGTLQLFPRTVGKGLKEQALAKCMAHVREDQACLASPGAGPAHRTSSCRTDLSRAFLQGLPFQWVQSRAYNRQARPMWRGVLRHRGQTSGPDQSPQVCSSYEVTLASHCSAPGFSFPTHWLKNALPSLALPAICMEQAKGPVPTGSRTLSECLGFFHLRQVGHFLTHRLGWDLCIPLGPCSLHPRKASQTHLDPSTWEAFRLEPIMPQRQPLPAPKSSDPSPTPASGS